MSKRDDMRQSKLFPDIPSSCPICGESNKKYQFSIHGFTVVSCSGCGVLSTTLVDKKNNNYGGINKSEIDLNNDSSIQALSMLEFLNRFFKPKSRMK